MIKIPLIRKTQEFYDFALKLTESDEMTVICPNPAIADSVRNRFDSLGRKVNSITISKFMKEELNAVIDEDILKNYKGKSELIVILGAVWKKIGKKPNYIDFKRAFNLLTEFRSFSTSEHVLETVLENYEEALSHGVLWLHRFLDQLEIVDEHKSYFLLSERLRQGDLDPGLEQDRNLLFYGFDFLTGSQVDLLKSIALRDNVIIPFYKQAYEKSISTDWVNWFDPHNQEVIDVCENSQTSKKAKLVRFSKGYLAQSLQSGAQNFSHVVIGTKKILREDLQELPFPSLKAKVGVNIFEECFLNLKASLNAQGDYSLEELTQKTINLINQARGEKNYRFIKTCLIFLEKINEWFELSSELLDINQFDLEILFEATELDLPRISFSSLSTEYSTELSSVREIEDIKISDVAFCLTSNYQGLGGSSHNYSENVEKYLASIGPVRRAELEQEVLKSRLVEFNEDNDVNFFIERNILEHKTNISNLFEEIEFELVGNTSSQIAEKKYYPMDISKKELVSLSASRLQKYFECPRKYALTYLNKIMPFYKIPGELSVLDLGRIEHLVIETYFKKNQDWSEIAFNKVISDLLELYRAEPTLKIKDENVVEIISYTKEAILTLVEMKTQFGMTYEFELPFQMREENINFNGSIDLFASGVETNMIVDFKRSNASFTSYQSLKDFEQIQLWFYLLRMYKAKKVSLTQDLAIGYIDLSNIENSLFLTNSPTLLSELKNIKKFTKVQLLSDFEDLLEEYQKFENEVIANLNSDISFAPNPSSPRSCNFCSISSICPKDNKGALDDNA